MLVTNQPTINVSKISNDKHAYVIIVNDQGKAFMCFKPTHRLSNNRVNGLRNIMVLPVVFNITTKQIEFAEDKGHITTCSNMRTLIEHYMLLKYEVHYFTRNNHEIEAFFLNLGGENTTI